MKKVYPLYFLIPILVIYVVMFIIPTIGSFYFSLTVWTLKDFRFIGLNNFVTFFSEPSMRIGISNTLIYAIFTCGLKLIIAMPLAVFLTSEIKSKNFIRSVVFFPHLISKLAIGLTFCSFMNPTKGLFNQVLGLVGIQGPDWLGNKSLALPSVIFADVWEGLGVATVILMAGIQAISPAYYEAAEIDGANNWNVFWKVTIPLSRSSINSVIMLAFISGLRTYDMIWAMTKGGPGFTTDVLASIIYKQYAAGFYGLATAGNVVMFVFIAILSFPLYRYLMSKEEYSI